MLQTAFWVKLPKANVKGPFSRQKLPLRKIGGPVKIKMWGPTWSIRVFWRTVADAEQFARFGEHRDNCDVECILKTLCDIIIHLSLNFLFCFVLLFSYIQTSMLKLHGSSSSCWILHCYISESQCSKAVEKIPTKSPSSPQVLKEVKTVQFPSQIAMGIISCSFPFCPLSFPLYHWLYLWYVFRNTSNIFTHTIGMFC